MRWLANMCYKQLLRRERRSNFGNGSISICCHKSCEKVCEVKNAFVETKTLHLNYSFLGKKTFVFQNILCNIVKITDCWIVVCYMKQHHHQTIQESRKSIFFYLEQLIWKTFWYYLTFLFYRTLTLSSCTSIFYAWWSLTQRGNF